MPSDAQPPASLSADEFFALVDATLTDPMAALGFFRIGESINRNRGTRSLLTLGGRRESAKEPFLEFVFGFEAGSDEVERLVHPDRPPCDDEWWLSYGPATGRLRFSDWEPVASGQVHWDIRTDDGPCSGQEVKRRLLAVGSAVSAFVAAHGGFPISN